MFCQLSIKNCCTYWVFGKVLRILQEWELTDSPILRGVYALIKMRSLLGEKIITAQCYASDGFQKPKERSQLNHPELLWSWTQERLHQKARRQTNLTDEEEKEPYVQMLQKDRALWETPHFLSQKEQKQQKMCGHGDRLLVTEALVGSMCFNSPWL